MLAVRWDRPRLGPNLGPTGLQFSSEPRLPLAKGLLRIRPSTATASCAVRILDVLSARSLKWRPSELAEEVVDAVSNHPCCHRVASMDYKSKYPTK